MFRTACTHHQLPELLITFHAAFFVIQLFVTWDP